MLLAKSEPNPLAPFPNREGGTGSYPDTGRSCMGKKAKNVQNLT
jgi:hypothetical protein